MTVKYFESAAGAKVRLLWKQKGNRVSIPSGKLCCKGEGGDAGGKSRRWSSA